MSFMEYRLRLLVFAVGAALVVAIAVVVLNHWGRSVEQRVGFYSPGGIPHEVIPKTAIGVFNAVTAQQIDKNLRQLEETEFSAIVDLGQVITRAMDPSLVGTTYESPGRETRKKMLAPKIDGNILEFLPDDELIAKLGPLLDAMADHSAHVDAVFLVDEPYLNGIAKSELERVGSIVRRELDTRGLQKVRLGVVFASAMFDSEFARMLNAQAGAYVSLIDFQLKNGAAAQAGFQEWAANIREHRLATYDRAGNMYVGGGLPRGFDVVGFDFYLSTLLLDGLYENSLSWFADRYPSEHCNHFEAKRVSELRGALSFFQAGPVVQDASERLMDERILDRMFLCRMGATTAMLERAAAGREFDFMLVSESSSNGVLEFDRSGNVEQRQPQLLVESRVLDEVERAQRFYLAHQCFYSAGLLYFTFADAYDFAIDLNVGGVASMPSVKTSIFEFADSEEGRSTDCGIHDYWLDITSG